MQLARDRTASPSCLAVFTWALARLNFKTFEMINQADIGLDLGLSQATIGRALRDLMERGFLERQGAGPRQTWRITPKGAWFGTAAAYQKDKRDRGSNPAGLKLVHDRDPDTMDIEEFIGGPDA